MKKTKWEVSFTFEGKAYVFAETLEEAKDLVYSTVGVEIAEDFWEDEADYEVEGPMINLVSHIYNEDGTIVEMEEDDE